jgi:MFS family permease
VAVPAPLRRPDFRALWLAGLISDAGDWMLLVALPIVVYRLTGSALGTAVAFIAELAPGVVLGPLAGRLADRVDRRRLMIVVSLVQALALLPLLTVHGAGDLTVVYAVILVQAGLATMFDPAKNALLPTLLPGDQLVSGNSLIGLNAALGRLAGGPLGGLLLATGALPTIVIADAVSFLVAARLIASLPRMRDRPAASASASVAATTATPATAAAAATAESPALAESPGVSARSFRAALRGPQVRAALLVAFVADIAQGIFVVLFILFVATRLHGGSGEIGLLRGVQAVGAIGAGLWLSVARRPRPPGELVAAALVVFGVIDLTVWNAPLVTTAIPAYVVLFIAVGAPGVVAETGLISVLQLAGAEGERGQIFGAAMLVSSAGQAIGMLAAGTLTGVIGLMGMLNAQGCLYLAAGALAARTLLPRAGARSLVPLRLPLTGRRPSERHLDAVDRGAVTDVTPDPRVEHVDIGASGDSLRPLTLR